MCPPVRRTRAANAVVLALVTLLGWQRTLTKVTVAYTLTSLPVFYLHHYWSWHMSGGFVLLYRLGVPSLWAGVAGAVAGFGLRAGAIHYGWALPAFGEKRAK